LFNLYIYIKWKKKNNLNYYFFKYDINYNCKLIFNILFIIFIVIVIVIQNSYNKSCKVDSDCPAYFECDQSQKCILPFFCINDNSICSYNKIARSFCNNSVCDPENCNYNAERNMCSSNSKAECTSDEDCLSNSCITYSKKCSVNTFKNCIAGNNNTRCGKIISETCKVNEDCLSNYCRHGTCEVAPQSTVFTYLLLGGVGIISILLFSFFVYLLKKFCGRRQRKYDYYNNGNYY